MSQHGMMPDPDQEGVYMASRCSNPTLNSFLTRWALGPTPCRVLPIAWETDPDLPPFSCGGVNWAEHCDKKWLSFSSLHPIEDNYFPIYLVIYLLAAVRWDYKQYDLSLSQLDTLCRI